MLNNNSDYNLIGATIGGGTSSIIHWFYTVFLVHQSPRCTAAVSTQHSLRRWSAVNVNKKA